MMLGGAVLLALALLTGEMHPFPHIPLRAAVALLYLIVGGSLVGFTAYVWLLARMPATRSRAMHTSIRSSPSPWATSWRGRKLRRECWLPRRSWWRVCFDLEAVVCDRQLKLVTSLCHLHRGPKRMSC